MSPQESGAESDEQNLAETPTCNMIMYNIPFE